MERWKNVSQLKTSVRLILLSLKLSLFLFSLRAEIHSSKHGAYNSYLDSQKKHKLLCKKPHFICNLYMEENSNNQATCHIQNVSPSHSCSSTPTVKQTPSHFSYVDQIYLSNIFIILLACIFVQNKLSYFERLRISHTSSNLNFLQFILLKYSLLHKISKCIYLHLLKCIYPFIPVNEYLCITISTTLLMRRY